MALGIILILGLLAIVFLPQMWVKSVMRRHGGERSDLTMTGGQMARHLLDAHGLTHVKVEVTRDGDHYDPDAKVVRLLLSISGGARSPAS